MKRLVSIFISLVVVCCLSSTVMAADFYKDTGLAQYTFSVPSTLRPGNSGWVSIEGTWPEYVKVVVSARDTVKLKNVATGEIEYLDVDFGGLSLVGNGSEVVSDSSLIAIEDFDMRFGKWSGSVSYSVDVIEMTILNVDANGGEVIGAADTVIKYGEVIPGEEMSLPADMLYREGYELVGFSEDPYATEGDFNYLIPDRTGLITLYAVWSEVKPTEPECICGLLEGETHAEGCPLWVEPEPTETEPQEPTEEEPKDSVYSIEDDAEILDLVDSGTETTCTCATTTETHLDTCPLYVAPTPTEGTPSEGETEAIPTEDTVEPTPNEDGTESWESPDDSEETGGQDPPVDTVTTIHFMISDTSYEVPSEFTWQDLVGSEYNPNALFEIIDNQVFYDSQLVGLDGIAVLSTDTILTDTVYVLLVVDSVETDNEENNDFVNEDTISEDTAANEETDNTDTDNGDNGIPEENNDSVGSEGEDIESVEETKDIEQEDIDSDPTVEDSGDNEIPEEAPAEGAPLEGENEIDIE